MRKRVHQFLGGLLAVGALAAAPAAASADAPSSARAAGDSGCSPQSHFGHGWWGHDDGGGYGPYWRGWDNDGGHFGGHSYLPYCYGGRNDQAGTKRPRIARVMVAVDRLRGARCQHLFRNGRLGRRADCDEPHWMRARGKRHWRHQIPRVLPSGHYRLRHRAIDGDGVRGRVHGRVMRIR